MNKQAYIKRLASLREQGGPDMPSSRRRLRNQPGTLRSVSSLPNLDFPVPFANNQSGKRTHFLGQQFEQVVQ